MRCRYCMPDGPAGAWLPREALLSYEEIARFTAIAAAHGVTQVRVTGGEPLLRRALHRLVALVRAVDGIERIALTTNGVLLPRQLPALLQAGLDAVTVSIDSLDPEVFRRLSGGADVREVRAGIEAAAEHGVPERKLNAVLIRGENDGELEELIRYGRAVGAEMRFIEFMPFGTHWGPDAVVPMHEIVSRVEAALGPVAPISVPASSTSRRWYVPSIDASFGVIPTMSETLCGHCDRIRLTAEGRVLNCLFDQRGSSVREALRANDAAAVAARLRGWVAAKGPGYLASRPQQDFVALDHMYQVGG